MRYISLGGKDKKDMLEKIGVSSVEELFSMIPEEIRLKKKLHIPEELSEPDLIRLFEEIANKNLYDNYISFLGAGAYAHFIPSVVDYLSSRGEFVTPYTPYQPEVSQGTLQAIFEFQTLICQLTGMDIANASLYDGASGAAEAVLMAHRLNGKPKLLMANTLHPHYKDTIRTYTKNLGLAIEEIRFTESGATDFSDLKEKLDENTSAVIIQSPNFFGVVEQIDAVSELTHKNKAMCIVAVAEPVSLGLLEAPGALNADIVVGEGQSLGISLTFGGPYVGFMACAKEFVRQFPGRIVGQTKDVDGKRGFVLTISTREQHIRRERATSNICTNQALCALRATIYLEALGKEGLKELAWQNIQKANYALDKLSMVKGIKRKFTGGIFNEFVLEFERPWPELEAYLKEKGIIGGLGLDEYYPELKNCALFCVTEMHKKEDIDRLFEYLKEALIQS
ncbi:MAG: aminomethyl-transferring glycine dehydrogenase subunit GcvPA [Acidobacteriota bacterium]|nr:aminomethyl-transferring glycine dehydrogenase subunit GcvPA [Acidobacteriota bacterium]